MLITNITLNSHFNYTLNIRIASRYCFSIDETLVKIITPQKQVFDFRKCN